MKGRTDNETRVKEEGNIMMDRRKARRNFKIEQETQDNVKIVSRIYRNNNKI